MIFTQILANILAILNIGLLANGYVWYGSWVGLLAQPLWLFMFYKNNLKILMLTNSIMAVIFIHTLYNY